MIRIKSLGVLAGAALCLASSAGLAQDADHAYRSELLADAEGRTSLLAANASVHHEHGHFGFTDASGNNSLYFGAFTQYRHLFNFAETNDANGTDDFSHGGQLARLRVLMFGTVGSPDMEYFIQLGADGVNFGYADAGGSDGSFVSSDSDNADLSVLDAVFKYTFGESGIYARFGQGRPAQGFEETTNPWDQQFMDRSLPNDLLAPGRQQFIAVGYDDGEMLHAEVFFSDGANTQDTDFVNVSEADAAIGGRINAVFMGKPEDFRTQSSFPGSPQGLRAGVGGQWETHGDTGLGAPPDFDAIYGNADVEFRGDGFSVRGHAYILFIDPRDNAGSEVTHVGGALRGGYFIDPQWEAFLGWEVIAFDEDVVGEDDSLQNIIRGGVNFFPFEQSNAVRFTGEVVVGIDNTSIINSGVANLFGSNANNPDFSGTRQNILGESDTEVGFGFQASVLN